MPDPLMVKRAQWPLSESSQLDGRPGASHVRRNSRPVRRPSVGRGPTPGVDDSPYIRFAIDQLTRDEEVRDSTHIPRPSASDDYPVERLVHDEGLGYVQRERQPVLEEEEEETEQLEVAEICRDEPGMFELMSLQLFYQLILFDFHRPKHVTSRDYKWVT